MTSRPGPVRAGLRRARVIPRKTSAIKIYAAPGSPVVAVKAGLITAIGSSSTRGRSVHLRDAYGNTYVYSQLGRLAATFAKSAPIDNRAAVFGLAAGAPVLPVDPVPQGPATAGHQVGPTASPSVPGALSPGRPGPATVPLATDTSAGPQRLFAHPRLPSSFAAGGQAQLASGSPNPSGYTTIPGVTSPAGTVLEPLAVGVHVLAGTILGQVGPRTATAAPHISFQIRPPGRATPYVDPKPILDGWQLLQATAGQPAAGASALFGPARAAALDKIGWETSAELQAQILANPSIVIDPVVRRAIESGLVVQPALAALEYLAAAGLRPTLSGVRGVSDPLSGLPASAAPSTAAAPVTGLELSAINGVPVLGHQGTGSITDITIRQLLALPAAVRPVGIDSATAGSPIGAATPGPDHTDRIVLTFALPAGASPILGELAGVGLTPPQWLSLIGHLDKLGNPAVANGRSSAAIAPRPGP